RIDAEGRLILKGGGSPLPLPIRMKKSRPVLLSERELPGYSEVARLELRREAGFREGLVRFELELHHYWTLPGNEYTEHAGPVAVLYAHIDEDGAIHVLSDEELEAYVWESTLRAARVRVGTKEVQFSNLILPSPALLKATEHYSLVLHDGVGNVLSRLELPPRMLWMEDSQTLQSIWERIPFNGGDAQKRVFLSVTDEDTDRAVMTLKGTIDSGKGEVCWEEPAEWSPASGAVMEMIETTRSAVERAAEVSRLLGQYL
ncbi:MAG: hypothetical protein JW937_06975, partial [Candidatus Omnitrophica bacterium]|nr:hypothetical protein [Candidatus Omnitrophota bacterium]